jgi:hypothetical protein
VLNPVTLYPGDYNNDRVVDAADYVVWRKNEGTQAGFDLWRAHFGETASAGSDIHGSIPEPAALLLVVMAMTLTILTRRPIQICKT